MAVRRALWDGQTPRGSNPLSGLGLVGTRGAVPAGAWHSHPHRVFGAFGFTPVLLRLQQAQELSGILLKGRSGSAGPGWGLTVSISSQLPAGADAAVRTTRGGGTRSGIRAVGAGELRAGTPVHTLSVPKHHVGSPCLRYPDDSDTGKRCQ